MSNLNASKIDTYTKLIELDNTSEAVIDLAFPLQGCKTIVYKIFGDMLGTEPGAIPQLINVNIGGNQMIMWNQTLQNYPNEFIFSVATGRSLSGRLNIRFTDVLGRPYPQDGTFGISVMGVWP